MTSAQVAAPLAEASLLPLRGQLAADGMTATALEDALALVRRVGDEPASAAQLRQALAQPAGLAQAILRAAPRVASAWTVVGLLALAAFAGPLLAYAILEPSSQTAPAIGDPFQGYAANLPGWAGLAAGIIGAGLLIVFLWMVARYQQPTRLGFFGGLVGGFIEIMVAVLPWVAIVGSKTTCVAHSGCTVQAGVPAQIGLAATITFAIPFVLVVTGLSGALALWLQRRRMLAAIRSV
jgi:hypothetical protein